MSLFILQVCCDCQWWHNGMVRTLLALLISVWILQVWLSVMVQSISFHARILVSLIVFMVLLWIHIRLSRALSWGTWRSLRLLITSNQLVLLRMLTDIPYSTLLNISLCTKSSSSECLEWKFYNLMMLESSRMLMVAMPKRQIMPNAHIPSTHDFFTKLISCSCNLFHYTNPQKKS
jgi:hypothetical protein